MTKSHSTVEYTVEVTIDDKTGTVIRETWMNADGEPDRPGDRPASTEYSLDTGAVTGQSWFRAGKLHRDGGKPASVYIDPETGVYTKTAYFVDGKQEDQRNEPAVVWRNPNGSLLQQTFMRSGRRHREDGPAHIEYDEQTGQLVAEQFWIDGKRVEPF